MLKLLSSSSSSSLHGRLHSLRPGPTELASPVLRVLGSLTGLTWPSPNSARRAFFCSDGSDGSDQVVEIEFKGAGAEAEAEAESKSSSAIVSTNPRPEDYLTVGWLWNLVLLSGLFGFRENIRKCLGFLLILHVYKLRDGFFHSHRANMFVFWLMLYGAGFSFAIAA